MVDMFHYISDEEYLYNSYKYKKQLRGTLIEVHISDIHFGVINPEYQYNILKEQFINKIKDLPIDIISIDGDLFDHKFMSNSDSVMYASLFVDNLVSICKRKNATLVMISGTESHDAQQLKLFYHYLDDKSVDVRIVEEVKFEYIKGAKILCIPELYGKKSDYYNHFLFESGMYDEAFMHGDLIGATFIKNPEKGLDSEDRPSFKISDFDSCKGPIISGHIHIGGCFNKHFYYCGSPLRFHFEEEQAKGFLLLLDNLDSGNYFIHFEEIKSYRYITMNIDNMITQDPKDLIKYINERKEKENIDYFKIKVEKDLNDKEIANLEILKSYFRTNMSVKLEYQNYKNKKVLKANEEVLSQYEGYEFVLDKKLDDYEKLARFINKKEDCKYITGEELKEIVKETI